MELLCYSATGDEPARVTVDESILGDRVRRRSVRLAVLQYQANRRVGTACTRTRREVAGSDRKPWKQKHTGRARHGDRRSPIWKGGGTTFGPRPRSYRTGLTRRHRLEALKDALLGKLRDGEVVLFDRLQLEKPRTREAAALLKRVGRPGSTLVVTAERDEIQWRSFRNLPRVSVLPAAEVNALAILSHRTLVLERTAFDGIARRVTSAGQGKESPLGRNPAPVEAASSPASGAAPARLEG